MQEILNFTLFQAGWFACVLAGVNGKPLAAVTAAGVVIGISLCWSSGDRTDDVRLFLAVALIGFCVDTVNLPTNRTFSVAALVVAWAVVMPLFVWVAHGSRFLGRTPQEAR